MFRNIGMSRSLNAVTGCASFLLSIEAADVIVQLRKEKKLRDKIFHSKDHNIDKVHVVPYQPSYFYKEFISIQHKLTQLGEIAACDRFKDLTRQSMSLGRELPELINSIDKNLYGALNIVLKTKHVNNNIDINNLTYSDKVKSDVTSILGKSHGIYINAIESFENVDIGSIDSLTNSDEARSFVKEVEEIGVNDKYRVVPSNQVDTFQRNTFINIIKANSNLGQKELCLALIQERNKVVVELFAEFADYFESILEQKDIILYELSTNAEDASDLYSKMLLSIVLGFSSTILMEFFFYNGVSYNLQGLKEWLMIKFRNFKPFQFSLIGRIMPSNGAVGIRLKAGLLPAILLLSLSYVMRGSYLLVSKKAEELISYVNDYGENDDAINITDSSDDAVVAPVVVPGGTKYNPVSGWRLTTEMHNDMLNELLFRSILFRSLWFWTTPLNAMIFSSVAYALYKDPSLDPIVISRGWDEYTAMLYFFCKGVYLQNAYFISGLLFLPITMISFENIEPKMKEFYSTERKELNTNHDFIELNSKEYQPALELWRLLASLPITTNGLKSKPFIQPADNRNSDNSLITISDDKVRDELTQLSRRIMKMFNTGNNNKKNSNIMSPSDFASFMTSFHHALIVLKKRHQIQDAVVGTKNDDDSYQKELYRLLLLNLVPKEYLETNFNTLPYVLVPFNDYNNVKKIFINPFELMQSYYVRLFAGHGMKEEEINSYVKSKISHAGFKTIDHSLLEELEKELFVWHDCDKNTYMNRMQKYYEGTLQGFEITMKNFVDKEIVKFLHDSAGRPLTSEDYASIEKSAFAFFKHKNIGHLVLANSKAVQELGISNYFFHRLKVGRSQDKDVKTLFTDWEKFFTGPIFYNRMKTIIKSLYDENIKQYNENKFTRKA